VFLLGAWSYASGQEAAYLEDARATRVAATVIDDDLALMLARTCVAEISLQRGNAECMIMLSIQRARAERRGISLRKQVEAFHPIHRKRRDGSWYRNKARHFWVRGLTADGAQPRAWREVDGDWSKHRGAWLAMLDAVRAFLRGATLNPCPRAQDYGGRCEVATGACDPPGPLHVRVQCLDGDTAQAYWRIDYSRKGKTLPASVAAGGRR